MRKYFSSTVLLFLCYGGRIILAFHSIPFQYYFSTIFGTVHFVTFRFGSVHFVTFRFTDLEVQGTATAWCTGLATTCIAGKSSPIEGTQPMESLPPSPTACPVPALHVTEAPLEVIEKSRSAFAMALPVAIIAYNRGGGQNGK